jgi:hypothetical protein
MKYALYIPLAILWLLNDLYLKNEFHNFWTGKMSDVLGLILFPEILFLVFKNFFLNQNQFSLLIKTHLITYFVFILINIDQRINDLLYTFLFANQNGISDFTDLYCIPISLSFSILFNLLFLKNLPFRFLESIFIILTSLAFIGTSYLIPEIRMIKLVESIKEVRVKQNEEIQLTWYVIDCDETKFDLIILTEKDFQDRRFSSNEGSSREDKAYETVFEKNDTYIHKLKENEWKGIIQYTSLQEFYSNKLDTIQSFKIQFSEDDIKSVIDRAGKRIFRLKIKFPILSGDYKLFLKSRSKELNCKNQLEERFNNPRYGRRTFLLNPYSKDIGLVIL